MASGVVQFLQGQFNNWNDSVHNWAPVLDGNASNNSKPAVAKRQTRHVPWDSFASYQMVRQGTTHFVNLDDLDACDKTGCIDERMFYIFEHKDKCVHRGMKETPRYEAVYAVGTGFVRVKKAHLTAVYKKLGRTRREMCMEIMPDGTPYWVDRYFAHLVNKK